MVRRYLDINVYDALMQRLDFIFREFDNIYVSFSGGKDSGMLLNAVIDFRDSRYPSRTVGLYHQDFEAQYTVTTEYIERTFERLKDRTVLGLPPDGNTDCDEQLRNVLVPVG